MRILVSSSKRLEHAILHTNILMEIIYWNKLEWSIFSGNKKITVTENNEKAS